MVNNCSEECSLASVVVTIEYVVDRHEAFDKFVCDGVVRMRDANMADYDDGVDHEHAEVAVDIDEEIGSVVLAVVDNATHTETWGASPGLEVDVQDECAPPGALQKAFGRCMIRLTVCNPLPWISQSIQASHIDKSLPSSTKDLRHFWHDALRKNDLVYDLEAARNMDNASVTSHANTDGARNRADLVIKNLSLVIQLAFRQNVLRVLLATKCGVALFIWICIALSLFDPWREDRFVSDTWLPRVLFGSSVVLYVLTLCLLYGVRFESPLNGAVLTFLLCLEVCCWSSLCLFMSDLRVISWLCVALCGSMVVMYALSTLRRRVDNVTLLHPVAAAMGSVGITTALSSGVYYCFDNLTISIESFASVLIFVTSSSIWTGWTLQCMIESLVLEEYTRALVFYHTDVVVVCFVMPLRALQRGFTRCLELRRQAAAQQAIRVKSTESDHRDDDGSVTMHVRSGDPVEETQSFKISVAGSSDTLHDAALGCPSQDDGAVTNGATARRRSSIVESV